MGLLFLGSIVLALLYLSFGIINIRMNKKNNFSSIKIMSVIEICVACCFGFILFLPNLIISIIRLIILSEIKKDSREGS